MTTLRGRLTKDWSEFDQQRAAESTGRPQRTGAVARTLRGGFQGAAGAVFAGAASRAVTAMLRARSRGLGGALGAGAAGAVSGATRGVMRYMGAGAFAGLGQGYLFGKSLGDVDEAAVDHLMVRIAKAGGHDVSQESRGPDGRWVAGEGDANPAAATDAAAVHEALAATPGIKAAMARTVRNSLNLIHRGAQDLAGKVKATISDTRLESIAPTTSGGLQIVASARLPSPHKSYIRGTINIPGHVGSVHPAASRILGGMNAALRHHGILPVGDTAPIRFEFKNGRAPREARAAA